MPIWLAGIARWFGGFNIFNGEKLAKLLFYGVLITVALVIYTKLTQPTTRVIVKEGGNYTAAPCPRIQGFGCYLNSFKVGLSW